MAVKFTAGRSQDVVRAASLSTGAAWRQASRTPTPHEPQHRERTSRRERRRHGNVTNQSAASDYSADMAPPLVRVFALVSVLVPSMYAAGCAGTGTAASITAPTTSPTTETFTGTVPVGGTDAHNFTVALSNGQVNIILTAAGPPSTIFMGLGIGTPTDSTCTALSGGSVVTQAGASAQLSGTAAAGSYCVVVSDVGNQVADVTYSVTVTHY